MSLAPLVIVVAVAENGVIGRGGQLPWKLPEDLAHFKRLTEGHAVIMGRRTFEERRKPLPNRRNLVVSRTLAATDGIEIAASLTEAIALARTTDAEPRVIGGTAMFAEALPLVTRMYLTEVAGRPEGDTFFPPFDRAAFREVERRAGEGCSFVTYDRG